MNFKVEVDNGKYEYVFTDTGESFVNRNGEYWRDTVGDKFIFTMAYELYETREYLDKILDVLQDMPVDIDEILEARDE